MPTQTAQNEVQTAWYNIFVPSGILDTTLASLGVTGVFDFRSVPQNQPFDYVTLGDGYEIPDNTLGKRCYTYYPKIHIWSRQLGTQTASAILARINTLIDQVPLTLATHRHVGTSYQRAIWMPDPDGLTMHVSAQYMVWTEES